MALLNDIRFSDDWIFKHSMRMIWISTIRARERKRENFLLRSNPSLKLYTTKQTQHTVWTCWVWIRLLNSTFSWSGLWSVCVCVCAWGLKVLTVMVKSKEASEIEIIWNEVWTIPGLTGPWLGLILGFVVRIIVFYSVLTKTELQIVCVCVCILFALRFADLW